MTHTTIPSTTPTTTRSGLRTLYLIRAAFSLVWVAIMFATSASLTAKEKPTAIASVLLVVYPLWDVAATLQDRRTAGPGAGSPNRVATVNVVLGLAAAIGMVAAAFSTVGKALLVFGAWALLAGAAQLAVALRRRRAVSGQWPMMISGGQSVIAGVGIAAMSASKTSSLGTVAGYSAFGAFWFLVAAIAGRRSTADGVPGN